MSSITRVAYSPLGSARQYAVVSFGDGDWEITTLSVIMGGKVPALNGAEFGSGQVRFEKLVGEVVVEAHSLISGNFTAVHPLIMDSQKRIHGPGRIRSLITHGQSSEHTLAVTYRRVKH